MTIADYAELARERFPELAQTLWLDRPGAEEALRTLDDHENEFEIDGAAGRGESYRRAQRNLMVRARGLGSLFTLAADVSTPADIPAGWRLLDVLGGDGLLARVLPILAPQVTTRVLTGDMARNMVMAALRDGIPAVRQRAQFLFLRDNTMDAVIVAYGTHHISREDRPAACQEAARVLRPGGRLVLHDFEEGGSVAQWFSEVVHPYSRRGHPYVHFTATEMEECLAVSGLRSTGVQRVYDPLVIEADDPHAARSLMADYLFEMYGLVGLANRPPSADVRDTIWKLAQNYFIYPVREGPSLPEPTIYRRGSRWLAEVPRFALVATGEK